MNRITNAHLEAKVEWLNDITGNAKEPYTRKDGKFTANIGNYHISGAYGGVALHQMMNESGGIRDIFSRGHMPKRELAGLIDAYIKGLESK